MFVSSNLRVITWGEGDGDFYLLSQSLLLLLLLHHFSRVRLCATP